MWVLITFAFLLGVSVWVAAGILSFMNMIHDMRSNNETTEEVHNA